MSDSDKVFVGLIPKNYDRHLVPLIFQSYANDMAARVEARAPKSVLETAAGSGAVTRAVAAVLSSDATYTVSDLNGAMLDYARRPAAARYTPAMARGECESLAVR